MLARLLRPRRQPTDGPHVVSKFQYPAVGGKDNKVPVPVAKKPNSKKRPVPSKKSAGTATKKSSFPNPAVGGNGVWEPEQADLGAADVIKSYEELRPKEGDAQSNTNTKMCTDEDENTVAGVQSDGGDGGGQPFLGHSFWGCDALWCEICKCQMGWYSCRHGAGLPPLVGKRPRATRPNPHGNGTINEKRKRMEGTQTMDCLGSTAAASSSSNMCSLSSFQCAAPLRKKKPFLCPVCTLFRGRRSFISSESAKNGHVCSKKHLMAMQHVGPTILSRESMTDLFTYIEGPRPDFDRISTRQALEDYIEECGWDPEMADFAPQPSEAY